jgi:hypothetical protein
MRRVMERTKDRWIRRLEEQGMNEPDEQTIRVYYHNWDVYEEVGGVVEGVLGLVGFERYGAGTEVGTGVRDVAYSRRVVEEAPGDN